MLRTFLTLMCLTLILTPRAHAQEPTLQNVSVEEAVAFTVDAATYTPAFYAGRSEPTSGSTLRVVGYVRTAGSKGPFTFIWSVPGIHETNTTELPYDVMTFTAPEYDRIRINLTVRDGNGRVVGRSERFVALSEPSLHFYTENLLRGISRNAITNRYRMIADEFSVRSVPYFFNTEFDRSSYEIVWELDDTARQTPTPLTLNLSQEEVESGTRISQSVRNRSALTQAATAEFQLVYE